MQVAESLLVITCQCSPCANFCDAHFREHEPSKACSDIGFLAVQGFLPFPFLEPRKSGDRIGVLFGCFARKIEGDSWFTWWFNHSPGKPIYFQPKKTPMGDHLSMETTSQLINSPPVWKLRKVVLGPGSHQLINSVFRLGANFLTVPFLVGRLPLLK